MKILLVTVIAGLAAGPLSVAATSGISAASQPDLKIEDLVRKLADESFRVREKATRGLWELGEAALPALEEAAGSGDPEQSIRARDLLRKIQLHITPDTDPSVITLVERYGKAPPAEKSALMGKLRGKRAWRQMLKLHAAETNPEVREKLSEMMRAVAPQAARERLLQGDAAGARELLEMAPADAPGLLALAEFHRSHGTLEAELKRADAKQDPKAAAWRLALQRAAGNAAAARDEATAAGEPAISAVMAALAGDPLPWLRAVQQRTDQTPAIASYAAIAAKRWLGQKVRPADLDPLTRMLAARNSSERGAAINTLFLLGETDAAEPVFMKSEPLAAFHYFETLERVPEALQALGLDPTDPQYQPWVEKRLAKLVADNIEDQHGVSDHEEELIALANFLERRGQHAQAAAAFAKPLAAVAEKNPNAFVDFLGKLFGGRDSLSGACGLARGIAVSWAGDDEKRWDDLIATAFGDDELSRAWWDWLAEIKPRADRTERLDAMLALFGIGRDPAGLRAKWLQLVWEAAEAAPPDQREVLIERISQLAAESGDAAASLKAQDRLNPEARGKFFWGLRIIHFSAAERWNDAAELILKQIELITREQHDPGAALHAYAAAALRKAGRNQEAATHDRWAAQLALGNAQTAISIGNGYAYGRDYPRAAEWWARAAMQADPLSDEFGLAIKLHSDALLEKGRWQETAAVSEVIAAIYAASEYRWSNQLPFMRERLQADMARALARLGNDRPGATAILANCHRTFASDGSLADFFFPALRKAGLLQEHDAWFQDSWRRIEEVIARYPDSANTRNTAAWLAARSLRRLDDAEKHVRKALASNPAESAYLDTMAEIQFARGNRAKALEWSRQAVNFAPEDELLRRQQLRFLTEPPPK